MPNGCTGFSSGNPCNGQRPFHPPPAWGGGHGAVGGARCGSSGFPFSSNGAGQAARWQNPGQPGLLVAALSLARILGYLPGRLCINVGLFGPRAASVPNRRVHCPDSTEYTQDRGGYTR